MRARDRELHLKAKQKKKIAFKTKTQDPVGYDGSRRKCSLREGNSAAVIIACDVAYCANLTYDHC